MVRVKRSSAEPAWLGGFLASCGSVTRFSYSSNEEYCTACAEYFYSNVSKAVHPSKTSLLMYDKYDYTLSNEGTLEELLASTELLRVAVASMTYVRNIAVDFDDVISPYIPSFLRFINRVYNAGLEYSTLSLHNIPALMGRTGEGIREVYTAFEQSEEHTEMHLSPPSEDCITALKALGKRYGLVVVTARSHHLEGVTREYLDRYLLGVFKEVCFANCYSGIGERRDKEYFCRLHDCQVMLDDNLEHIKSANAAGIIGVLFGLYPWNQLENVPRRVEDWGQFREMMGV